MAAEDQYSTDASKFEAKQTTGKSLVALSVAQMFLIVAVWLVAWPETLGIPYGELDVAGVTGVLSGIAVIGFYVGFVSLWRNSKTLNR